jgi:hypothetical protein
MLLRIAEHLMLICNPNQVYCPIKSCKYRAKCLAAVIVLRKYLFEMSLYHEVEPSFNLAKLQLKPPRLPSWQINAFDGVGA